MHSDRRIARARRILKKNPRRDTDGRCPRRDVRKNHSIGADPSMIADRHTAQDLCASSHVDVSPQLWATGDRTARAERDLLEDQTICADDRLGMNHDAVGMRYQ
jgi:hypothetical protein